MAISYGKTDSSFYYDRPLTIQLDHTQMAFVIAVVFINIQLITHHVKPRSVQNVHKRSFWFSFRGVKNAHLL